MFGYACCKKDSQASALQFLVYCFHTKLTTFSNDDRIATTEISLTNRFILSYNKIPISLTSRN